MGKLGRIREVRRQMRSAESYPAWLALAGELDELEGAGRWRDDPASDLYHHELLNEQLQRMRALREGRRSTELVGALEESLHRHLNEIGNPELYQYAHSGTKRLIEEFLLEAEKCLRFLGGSSIPGLPAARKLERFRRAAANLGRSALMLSGGATFGIYHIGVAKALWEQGLLPRVISGSSMGAIVAGAICTRDDQALREFFLKPDLIHREAFELNSLARAVRDREIFDQSRLADAIRRNLEDMTFAEAHERSGRELNISVSPTRSRQKPRVLNRFTAPNVLISSSCLASCAIPGVFPAVVLRARNGDGSERDYMPTERWIDGSVHGDIPTARIARLHNVNHFIVSQANPYVVPFVAGAGGRGMFSSLKRLVMSTARTQTAELLEFARGVLDGTRARPLLDKMHAVTRQSYLGDINIHFPFNALLYRKLVSNPTPEELRRYIFDGERATWPRLAIVRDQTRIKRVLEACILEIEARLCRAETSPPDDVSQ